MNRFKKNIHSFFKCNIHSWFIRNMPDHWKGSRMHNDIYFMPPWSGLHFFDNTKKTVSHTLRHSVTDCTVHHHINWYGYTYLLVQKCMKACLSLDEQHIQQCQHLEETNSDYSDFTGCNDHITSTPQHSLYIFFGNVEHVRLIYESIFWGVFGSSTEYFAPFFLREFHS